MKLTNSEKGDVVRDAPVLPLPDSLRAAGLVAKHVELDDVCLRRLRAEVFTSSSIAAAEDLRWDYRDNTTSHVFDEGAGILSVVVSLIVNGTRVRRSETPKSKKLKRIASDSIVEIEVAVALEYRLVAEPPPPELREMLFSNFAALNGMYNAWPYLREQVQNVSTRLGLQPVVLPVFRVPRADEHALKEGNQGRHE